MSKTDPVVAKMCAILDNVVPGWYAGADIEAAPSESWRNEIRARRAREDARGEAGPLDARGLVVMHLADCLPPGSPPCYRSIVSARYVGSGRKRVAIAELVMFDGLLATVEVFRWGKNAYGHRWKSMDGGAVYFEDGRWHRDDEASEPLPERSGVARGD